MESQCSKQAQAFSMDPVPPKDQNEPKAPLISRADIS